MMLPVGKDDNDCVKSIDNVDKSSPDNNPMVEFLHSGTGNEELVYYNMGKTAISDTEYNESTENNLNASLIESFDDRATVHNEASIIAPSSDFSGVQPTGIDISTLVPIEGDNTTNDLDYPVLLHSTFLPSPESSSEDEIVNFIEKPEILDDILPQNTESLGYESIVTVRDNIEKDISGKLDPTQVTTSSTFQINSLSTVTRTATVSAHLVNDFDLNRNISMKSHSQKIFPKVSSNTTKVPFLKQSRVEFDSDRVFTHSIRDLPFDRVTTEKKTISSSEQDDKSVTTEIMVTLIPEAKNVDNVIFLKNKTKISSKDTFLPSANSNLSNANVSVESGERIKLDNSALVLSVAVSCAFALFIFIFLSLWLLRRNKNHSKVYLNYEVAKHKSYITKPMRPSILAAEINGSSSAKFLKQKPRPPILLAQEMENMTRAPKLKIFTSESCDSGIDNLAFADISSDGQSTASVAAKASESNFKRSKLAPKYTSKVHKKKAQNDALIRVCSSDGSIFPASPSLTKCFIPPPPYSPNIRDKDFNFSLHIPLSMSQESSINQKKAADLSLSSKAGSVDNSSTAVYDTVVNIT